MAGRLIVSLDFELFWGMTDCATLESYGENIRGARVAIPRLLRLFEQYDIHATWATVGLLFADDAADARRFTPAEALYPSYENEKLLTYRELATLAEVAENEECFFAPTLIDTIAKTPHQEIASHTFAHYYCREAGQTPAQFAADTAAAGAIAEAKGYTLSSVVLPRNQCETAYTKVLAQAGYTAYRDEENDWIHEKVRIRPLMRLLRLMDVYFPLTGQGGYHPQKEYGIWNLVGSRMYKPIVPKLRFLESLKLRRIKKQMLHAAKNDLTFHLWWHPHNIGVMTDEHLKQLEEIFAYYTTLRDTYGMQSRTMREAVEELEA